MHQFISCASTLRPEYSNLLHNLFVTERKIDCNFIVGVLFSFIDLLDYFLDGILSELLKLFRSIVGTKLIFVPGVGDGRALPQYFLDIFNHCFDISLKYLINCKQTIL